MISCEIHIFQTSISHLLHSLAHISCLSFSCSSVSRVENTYYNCVNNRFTVVVGEIESRDSSSVSLDSSPQAATQHVLRTLHIANKQKKVQSHITAYTHTNLHTNNSILC